MMMVMIMLAYDLILFVSKRMETQIKADIGLSITHAFVTSLSPIHGCTSLCSDVLMPRGDYRD